MDCLSGLGHSQKRLSNADTYTNYFDVKFLGLSLSTFAAGAISGCSDNTSGMLECLPGWNLMSKSKHPNVSDHPSLLLSQSTCGHEGLEVKVIALDNEVE